MRGAMVASIASAIALGIVFMPVSSRADSVTYVQTSDDCTGGCGTSSLNTVTVSTTGTTGQLSISVSLTTGFDFIHSGFPGSFGFGLTSINPLTFTMGSTTWSTTGWTPIASPVSATSPQSIAGTSMSWDGSGTFSNGYGMTWNGGNGIGNEDGTTLNFLISATGLTLSSFAADTTGSFFTADVAGTGTTCVQDVCTRNTGIIDFTQSVSTVPIPPAALLFGTALVGMGVLGRRRKKGLATAA